jgi:hypothetical protein
VPPGGDGTEQEGSPGEERRAPKAASREAGYIGSGSRGGKTRGVESAAGELQILFEPAVLPLGLEGSSIPQDRLREAVQMVGRGPEVVGQHRVRWVLPDPREVGLEGGGKIACPKPPVPLEEGLARRDRFFDPFLRLLSRILRSEAHG